MHGKLAPVTPAVVVVMVHLMATMELGLKCAAFRLVLKLESFRPGLLLLQKFIGRMETAAEAAAAVVVALRATPGG
jgi:hypothetical protein